MSLAKWLTFFLQAIVVGVVANITMDIGYWILEAFTGIVPDWHILGRWIGHTFQGDFTLYGIKKLSPIAHEQMLGWAGHYAIAIVYGFIYLFVVSRLLHRKPSLLSALIIAWCFMVMPFLLLQPAVGMGYFAMNTPRPWVAQLFTFCSHTVFGLGLYFGCLVLKWFHKKTTYSKNK